ncbi:MAG: Rpn family recombination-promoting nuclease/putative transposase, partial [Leptolyngbyaceae bacterium]|nr:Rpn family recombination-promoting nuclease/putative transposase [Leptolyngbyaceae bacterium]
MRRDTLFYRLFSQSPTLLFDLLDAAPPDAADYRFDSVAVKEPTFEIDGVFLPPDEGEYPKTVYFCEVQFQKDEELYERVFSEAFLYFYRQRQRFDDWQAVIIYPSRSLEQSNLHPYRALLDSDQVHRIYLQELGNLQQLPVGVGLLVLTTLSETQAAQQARLLFERTQAEISEPQRKAIIELIIMILSYRFTQLTRQEVEAMLDIRFEDTRLYQQLREESREEGREE